MEIQYFKAPQGNFGDDLNEWLWDSLIPGWREWDQATTLLGLGTLFTRLQLSQIKTKRVLVLGAGAGRKNVPAIDSSQFTWDIRAVRGPSTARRLSLPKECAITDPAVMISELEEFKQVGKSNQTLFIPHHNSVKTYAWHSLCELASLKFVSPCDESKYVIQQIAAANLVIAESLHAAIIADAFRVPWVPVCISADFDHQKWADWAESIGINLKIYKFFNSKIKTYAPKSRILSRYVNFFQFGSQRNMIPLVFEKIAKVAPILSDDSLLIAKKERYWEVLRKVVDDYS